MKRLSPTSRALPSYSHDSWGSAPLHPRLYAIATLRGLKASFRYFVQRFLPSTNRMRVQLRLLPLLNSLDQSPTSQPVFRQSDSD